MARTSAKASALAARREESRMLSTRGSPAVSAATLDSFTNFAFKLGVGGDNASSTASYGFNPITRNRVMLEWIYRGSWIGGIAVDAVADDMTRAGIDYVTEIPPADTERLDRTMTAMGTWTSINDVIKWGRLYGGALGVVMIDGQDMRTPLRVETVGPGQYRGIMVLDRWMVEPSLEDLVTEMGPHIGLPKYYRVTQAAPAMRGVAIHHSRVAIRHAGVSLPYQQALVENLWGLSVLERLYDRMIAFDSATAGAAQLVYKSYLRTLSVEGLREIVSAGGAPLNGLTSYVDMMRRFQGIEGMTVIDAKDKFEVQGHSAFSGLSDALNQFSQQLSGALQIPLVRLFGQSPGGLGSNGDSEMRTYYDHVNQQQMKMLHQGVTLMYKLGAQSLGIKLPPNFAIDFRSLWELTDSDKVNIAKTAGETVSAAVEGGLISQKTGLQELRQTSRVTGVFTNITKEMIDAADDTVQPPQGEDVLGGLLGQMPGSGGGDAPTPEHIAPGQLPGQPQGDMSGTTPGSQGQDGSLDQSPRSRVALQRPTPQRRPTTGGDRPGLTA